MYLSPFQDKFLCVSVGEQLREIKIERSSPHRKFIFHVADESRNGTIHDYHPFIPVKQFGSTLQLGDRASRHASFRLTISVNLHAYTCERRHDASPREREEG